MTGFGTGNGSCEYGEITVEMRSVNNRFLDVTMKAPRELIALEQDIRDLAKKKVQRGKFEVSIRWSKPAILNEVSSLDHQLLKKYFDEIEQSIGREAAIAAMPSLLRLPLITEMDETDVPNLDTAVFAALRQCVLTAFDQAFIVFNDARRQEGRCLVDDLRRRIGRLSELVEQLAAERERVFDDFVQKLRARAAELATQAEIEINQWRLEMETVMFADKCDISEELVRLRAHMTAFLGYIDKTDAETLVGKSLDFLVQELLREATTASNKCRSSQASAVCVEMKTEIEKIREQVQNIA